MFRIGYYGILTFFFACGSGKEYKTWQHYKGSGESIHYSSLSEIDTSNVNNLQVAWIYRTGDADSIHHSQIQTNPVIIDSVLYGVSPQMKLFAIHASTGREIWGFNPLDSLSDDKKNLFGLGNCRGVSYWSDGKNDRRIFYSAGSYLYAINALTGTMVTGFGENGKLDLHKGLDRNVDHLFISSTSPGIIFRDLIIMGSRVDEGAAAAPGHIRAFDVRTGERRWIFHTIPQPGEYGYESWDDTAAFRFIGGANVWSGFSLDQQRGIVYAGTGSASYDFYGRKRTGDNLFANSILALDAASGKRIWHYQYIHHDVWDRDFSSPPALVTVKRNGKQVDAVASTTKTGDVLLFDRETGTPLFEIIEKPVPTESDLTGEKLSATQPFPVKPAPFMRQQFTEKEINPLLSDTSYQAVKKRFVTYKNGHIYHPPSLQGTIVFPGLDGGAEWGGPSFDPETQILYINSNEMAWIIQAVDLSKVPAKAETYEQAGKRLYTQNCMRCHGAEFQGSGNFPAISDARNRYEPLAFRQLLQTGRRMMPAFNQLNENEQEAIATYVLNMKENKSRSFKEGREDPYRLPYSITGYNKFLSSEGYPAIAPPWGTLNALDLNTGDYLWQRPLGNDSRFNHHTETGTENYGASVVTKGGLLFIGATSDGKFRAFNKRSGEILWEYQLPVPAYASPAVYECMGKQFVVIACGGGKLGSPSGDYYIAFSLPEAK